MWPTVYIAMFGWPFVSLVLFSKMEPRKAVLASLLGGWLLLPQAGFALSGLPDYSRTTAVVLGLVLGVFFFDSDQLSNIHFQKLDLPMVVWCLCPLASSLSNGLGLYDGVSGVLTFIIDYGLPYLFGRLYFSGRDGMRDLAVGLILAVLCYTPLILFELRMSPQLHKDIYGFLQIPFHMIWRLGWYRPMVFLRHGLELGILVAGATITAFWLWRTQAVGKIGWLSSRISALTLLGTCLLCRALNGYVVVVTGLVILYLLLLLRARVIVLIIVLIPAVYIFARMVTNWNAASFVEAADSINPERAMSAQSRISHEITLIDKALRRPYFGWGGWNRNRADELAEGAMGHRSITDSFWIIVVGQHGLVGLISVGLVLLLPVILLVIRLPASAWSSPEKAPTAALSMVLFGFTIDCLMNAMISPIYFVIAGGLMGYQQVIELTPERKFA